MRRLADLSEGVDECPVYDVYVGIQGSRRQICRLRSDDSGKLMPSSTLTDFGVDFDL